MCLLGILLTGYQMPPLPINVPWKSPQCNSSLSFLQSPGFFLTSSAHCQGRLLVTKPNLNTRMGDLLFLGESALLGLQNSSWK